MCLIIKPPCLSRAPMPAKVSRVAEARTAVVCRWVVPSTSAVRMTCLQSQTPLQPPWIRRQMLVQIVSWSCGALAESGSCEADIAVEVAVSYVAATSPHAPQLNRCEMLLSLASCDDLPAPPVPPNHVSPLVDLLLPLSVQEFFLCFISDDHQFNTKVARFANHSARVILIRPLSLLFPSISTTPP